MTLYYKIEDTIGAADTETAAGLMEELARLAWDTNTDPAAIHSLTEAGITADDLRAAYDQ